MVFHGYGVFMRVLVTGGAGYIGSVMCGMLVDQGFSVTVLDRFFFGKETLDYLKGKIKLVKGDIRWVDSSVMKGIDAVIDMAALSNDPIGELNPKKTLEINYMGRARMARMAKKNKVGQYILASSCSVYGFQKEVVDEKSKIHPLTTYAKANALAEKASLPLADKNFTVTALRQSSVYGVSNRMRFDIACNNMTLSLFKGNKIPVMRDGKQQRPIIHIKDTSNGFITVLKAEKELVNGEVFNVGSKEQNFRLFDLAKTVSQGVGIPFKYEWYGDPDYRSYAVGFKKIERILGYRTKHTPKEGAREIYKALESGRLKNDEKTVTIQWYKKLAEMQKLITDAEIDGKLI